MQRSDESGGTRGPRADASEPEPLRAEQVSTSSLRDRIRQASTAAARVSELPPAPQPAGAATAGASLSSPLEPSGVHSRPAARGQAASSNPPSLSELFAPPMPGALRAPAVPREAVPVPQRSPTLTQLGLGVVPRPTSVPPVQAAVTHWPAPPRRTSTNKTVPGVVAPAVSTRSGSGASSDDITTARTQPMQRVAAPTLSSRPAKGLEQALPRQAAISAPVRAPRPAVPAPAMPARDTLITLPSVAPSRAVLPSPVPGLLRASPTGLPQDGRYSVHDVSAEYIETTARTTPPAFPPPTAAVTAAPVPAPATSPRAAPVTAPIALSSQVALVAEPAVAEVAEDVLDDSASRARRSTPAERPGRSRPTRVARHEVVARTHAQPACAAARDDDSGVQSLGRGAVELTSVGTDDQLLAHAAAILDVAAERDRKTQSVPPPRLQAAMRASAPSVPAAAPTAAPSVDRPSAAAMPPIMVESGLGARSVETAPAPSYEPLPPDREGFESFMRARMKDSEHMRPGWAEQETSLISRDSFRNPAVTVGAGAIGTPMRALLVTGALLAAAGAGLLWVKWKQGAEQIAATSLSTDASAQAPVTTVQLTTLMVTEPAGAEIVHGGAVVGNTPAEVPRPRQNDELYMLRMTGFESQLVRLSSAREVVRVTLRPLGFRDPAALPAGAEPTPAIAP